ncbi:MAG: sodium/glutamate symporter [Acidobacteria bacterium]|nr:sodium/glutamate symporter [Acidobacteriota bacterium]
MSDSNILAHFKLDMIQTLALASLVLFLGYVIRRRVGFLDRYNIPAPVVGGFLFAALALALRMSNLVAISFDTTLQAPLMIAFFTTIGLGASLSLLKVGGPQVLIFWGLASVLAVVQNGIGASLSGLLGVHPFLGLIAGSITMTGGHGTGAAFGQLMEQQYNFAGGVTLAMAAATFGLVSGGLIGGPIGTRLIHRLKRKEVQSPGRAPAREAEIEVEAHDSKDEIDQAVTGFTAYSLLKILTIALMAMWIGSLLSQWLGRFITLPGYIGSMIAAAVMRNLADLTPRIKIEQRLVDLVGTIALSLFLAMALMTLQLWELLDLAIPMLIILMAQVVALAAFSYFITYQVMGRDYDAAVMAAGHCGFGAGATPNAVANMEALVERFGPAPRAFLVLPMVGAFFIDFTNALIITAFINFVR